MSDTNTAILETGQARLVTGELLSSTPPVIDIGRAAEILDRHYGIKAELQRVSSERDANFHAVASDGREYALKISNSAESELNINFQTEALLWLERRDSGLPVPKVVRALDGRSEFPLQMADGRTSIVRALTWLRGMPVATLEVSAALRGDLGRTLARMDVALDGFDHPGSAHDILWDIKNASRLRPLLQSLSEEGLRQGLLKELDNFDARVRPVLGTLRQRVIHNDLNHHNAVMDPADPSRITGVLDFGDMVKTPLIVNIAVAASYHTHLGDDALVTVSELVGAYHQVLPLEPREIHVLRDLIVARMMTSIAITEWRAARYPDNANYILRNNGPARMGVARFATLAPDRVTSSLLETCGVD